MVRTESWRTPVLTCVLAEVILMQVVSQKPGDSQVPVYGQDPGDEPLPKHGDSWCEVAVASPSAAPNRSHFVSV